MKRLLSRPNDPSPERKRFIYYAHKLYNFALPIGLLLLIRVGLSELAILLALFSKWRVFTVKPRHLLANLRSNATDITVKLSTLAFMIKADTLTEQLLWTAWYIAWLTLIKPASAKSWVTFQAAAGHVLGISAVFLFSNSLNDAIILILVWLIAVTSARHFFSSYEEPKSQLMAHIWALFVVELAWVLGKWTLVYVFIPQLIFILAVVGYALGSIFDAYKEETLKASFIRQQAAMAAIILIMIILLADWQGNI